MRKVWLTLNELAAGERIAGVSFLARTARRVVHHGTLGVEAARTGARVGTLLPNARLVLGTFRAEHALGPAVWRRSGVVRQARAGFLASDDLALGVRTARWRNARRWWRWSCCANFLVTARERISGKVRTAAADRVVVDHLTLGVLTARSRARVNALVVHAGPLRFAISALYAFRATVWRSSGHFRLTLANCYSVLDSTDAVRSACALVAYWWRSSYWFLQSQLAPRERISDHSFRTYAGWYVVDDVAQCLRSAHTWTGINALEVNASQLLGAIAVDIALPSTAGEHVVRISFVVGQAVARSGIVTLSAFRVWTTWRWCTRRKTFRCCCRKRQVRVRKPTSFPGELWNTHVVASDRTAPADYPQSRRCTCKRLDGW